MAEYTVIKTSGWVGAGWHLDSFHEDRKAAAARRDAIRTTDAQSDSYIVAVVGGAKTCDKHEACYIVDASRVKVNGNPSHLVGRRAHVACYPTGEED